ncbi:GNAT family N-acetyltransferase [Parachryseolinea silvisoli]|uniref:GNAT family N-acetyltransferase n=1 Tax=Parachryseolinea silvisoli TaxID=2873601 RepID=UPI002265F7F2|nr:GNAT family N-acetyltransferase [Parachryseolinea silvisoli]MCD9017564.1 GNAT family N-acetyltransferase [Parachryseolinea silvisoli]
MRRAEDTDRALVVDILVKSFHDNKSVNHVVKQDRHKAKRMKALMEYSFDLCLSFGEIWIGDGNTGCALILYPREKKQTLRSILLDIKVAIFAIGLLRVASIAKREQAIKGHHPKGDITYLWFIGVDPKYQHQGIGSTLLLNVIDRSKMAQRPIYLETSSLKNVAWYNSFGFEVFEMLEFSYTLFLFRRTGYRTGSI